MGGELEVRLRPGPRGGGRDRRRLDGPEDVWKTCRDLVDADRERFHVLHLDAGNRLLAREEVRSWDASMLERPQVVAASKRDLAGMNDPLPALRTEAAKLGLDVLAVSAVTGEGLATLTRHLDRLLASAPSLPLEQHP